jgi:hypothetical protein
MAWRKGPHSDEIYAEWDQLVLDKGTKLSLEERERRWRALYEKFFVDGQWIVSPDDAGLISSLGKWTAIEARDWELANRLCREFLSQDQLDERKDRIAVMDHYIWEGISEILMGRVDEGVTRLREPFHDKRFKVGEYRSSLRLDLGGLLVEGMDSGAVADRNVASLVQDLIASFPNSKRLSGRVSGAITNGDLNRLIDQTYPHLKKKKDLQESNPAGPN